MSVRQESLATSEGALVSISIAVEAQQLESLLEVLALLDFPVNPAIYHEAAIVRRYADGHEEADPTTLVEFPAYAGRVGEVRQAVESAGFEAAAIQVTSMLEELQAEPQPHSGVTRYRVKVARPALV